MAGFIATAPTVAGEEDREFLARTGI